MQKINWKFRLLASSIFALILSLGFHARPRPASGHWNFICNPQIPVVCWQQLILSIILWALCILIVIYVIWWLKDKIFKS
jgi:hypothetical protein